MVNHGTAKNGKLEQAGSMQDKASALEKCTRETTKIMSMVKKAKRDTEQAMQAHNIMKEYFIQGKSHNIYKA